MQQNTNYKVLPVMIQLKVPQGIAYQRPRSKQSSNSYCHPQFPADGDRCRVLYQHCFSFCPRNPREQKYELPVQLFILQTKENGHLLFWLLAIMYRARCTISFDAPSSSARKLLCRYVPNSRKKQWTWKYVLRPFINITEYFVQFSAPTTFCTIVVVMQIKTPLLTERNLF